MRDDVLTFRHTIRAPSAGTIVRRGWYYGPTFRQKPYDVRPMAAPIPYAPPLPWHRRKRTRVLILRLVIIASFLCGSAWLYRFAQQLQFLAQQQRWMSYTMPPDKIVLAVGTADAPALLSSPDYHKLWNLPIFADPSTTRFLPAVASNVPQALAQLGAGDVPVFVHGLRAPSHDMRLVSVSLNADYGEPFLTADVSVPASIYLGSRPYPCPNWGTETARFGRFKTFRIFAGQPDPADSRHFTIRYELDGKSNTIDGWLMPDDTVQLQPRI